VSDPAQPNPAQRRLMMVTKGSTGVTAGMLAKAEAALSKLAETYPPMARQEVEEVAEAVAQGDAERVFQLMHVVKGQAATLGQPIIGRLAASLCELARETERLDKSIAVPHVAAMKAALSHGEDAVANEVVEELEALVLKARGPRVDPRQKPALKRKKP